VTPYRLVDTEVTVLGPFSTQKSNAMEVEAAHFFEASLNISHLTRRHIQDDPNRQLYSLSLSFSPYANQVSDQKLMDYR
jgi:hypothetical protein